MHRYLLAIELIEKTEHSVYKNGTEKTHGHLSNSSEEQKVRAIYNQNPAKRIREKSIRGA